LRGPIYVILFGLIFFGIGAGLSYRQIIFRRTAVEVPGEVTGHAPSCDDEGCTYMSVVNFETLEGQSVSYTSTFSSSPPSHKVGEAVMVFYAPDNPQDALIRGEGIVFRIIFTIIGGVIILFGLVFFASNLKSSFLAKEG